MTARGKGVERRSAPGGFAVAPAAKLEGGHLDGFAALAGGCVLVDPFQVAGDDAGVNLGRGQVRVAEHFLNVADGCPALQHFGGAGVTQAVGGGRPGEPGGVAVAHEDAAEDRGTQGRAVVGQEQPPHFRAIRGPALVTGHDDGAHPVEVFGHVIEGDFADGDDAVFFPLGLVHAHGAVFEVDVVNVEPAKLDPAQAAGVEHFEHGAVPVAERGGNVGLGEPAKHLGIGQNPFRQPMGLAEFWEVGEGVNEDAATLFQERVKVGDGMDFGLTVAECQGLAALVAMPPPIFVIVLQLLEGYIADVGPVEVRKEVPDVHQAVLDGERRQMPRV
jgi:hypothetical protein